MMREIIVLKEQPIPDTVRIAELQAQVDHIQNQANRHYDKAGDFLPR